MRLLGIAAPEMRELGRPEGKVYLLELAEGRTVVCEFVRECIWARAGGRNWVPGLNAVLNHSKREVAAVPYPVAYGHHRAGADRRARGSDPVANDPGRRQDAALRPARVTIQR
jgi:hypothetical protein